MVITLEIPDDISAALMAGSADLSRLVLEALALESYRAGQLTQAQVRRLLGYQTRMEVDGFLKEHGIALEYSLEDLDREADISRRLWERRQQELAREAQDHPKQRAG